MSAVTDYAGQVARAYQFADQRTPAHLVPDTPDGIFYKQIPNVVAWITNKIADRAAGADLYAQSGHDLRAGAREKLYELLSSGIGNFPFSTVAALGGWRGTLKWLLERPVFTWNKDQAGEVYSPVAILEEVPLPVQRRAADAYSIAPGLAFAYLGSAPDAAGRVGPAMEPGRVHQAYYHPDFGIVFNEPFRNAIAASLGGMVNRQVMGVAWREDRIWNLDPSLAWDRQSHQPAHAAAFNTARNAAMARGELQFTHCPHAQACYTYSTYDPVPPEYMAEVAAFTGMLCFPGEPSSGDCTGHAQFYAEYLVEPWRAFPWVTSAFHQPRVIYGPLNDVAGKARSARRKADVMSAVEAIAIFFALTGLGTALVAVLETGVTLATAADLVVAVDRVPGVDFGETGKVLSLANGNLDLEAFSADAGLSSLNYEAALAPIEDVPMWDDLPMPEFDLPEFEVPVLDEFELPIYEGDYADFDFDTYDFGGDWLSDAWSDMPEFDLGWNNETPAFDPSGQASDDALFASMGIEPFDSGIAAMADDSGGWFDGFSLSDIPLKFITDLGTMYLQYDLQKDAIEAQQGRAVPPQAVRPTPGTSGRLPDGSTYVVNPNGSTTVRSPNGQVRTVNPNGQVVTGVPGSARAPMGSLIPGVSNTVLMAGALGAGALLFMASRK